MHEEKDDRNPFSRIPLDFAAILTSVHIPLLKETPLSETLELLKRKSSGEPSDNHRTQELVSSGIRSATHHLQLDFVQLYNFDCEWKAGKYFSTNSGAGLIALRTSSMWYDADKYLEISSELRKFKNMPSMNGVVLQEPGLAESTLDLANRLFHQVSKASIERMK
jgi:hypothetical protein